MFCGDCDQHVLDCNCPDMEQRLLSLPNPFAPAVVSALVLRARSHFTIEHDAHNIIANCHDCESALVFAAARISDQLLNGFLLGHREECPGELRRQAVRIN